MNFTAILNTAQTVLSALNVVLIALLTSIGCAPDPVTAKMVCTVSAFPWLSVETLAWVAGVSNVLKFVILPWIAPGGILRNLFGEKTVVTPNPTPGTVSPTDVR